MKIAFVTTQNSNGSTVIGRVTPIARSIAVNNEVHLLLLGKNKTTASNITNHSTGLEPFTRTPEGKKRLSGFSLIYRLLSNSIKTSAKLFSIKPDTVIIVKPLPQNTLGVRIWKIFNPKAKVILDVDDFELTANVLTSFIQRAAIHWSERSASKMANQIVTATPFLKDHFEQLTKGKKKVTMIPTGIKPRAKKLNHTDIGRPTLLYIGSVSISSGHRVDLLPAALSLVKKSYPDIRMTIAGDGDDVTKLKEGFRKLGLENNVTWFGRFKDEDIDNLLVNHPIIIDPVDSKVVNRAKSSFRVALAASTGLPVVTNNVGIRPYLLPDSLHNRFFAQESSPESYTQTIVQLLNDPLSGEQSASLIKHSVKYNWDNLSKEYLALLN